MFRHERTRPHGTTARVAVAASALLVALAGAAEAQMIPSAPAQAPSPAPPGKAAKGAAKSQPAAEAGKKDPAAALKSLESGVRAYEAGKLDPAAQSLTAALAGGLPSKQMARALYFRGLTFRKQGKPALAISDLTSAIWLKGGLDETERAAAIESRAAAYREAGLGEPPPVGGDGARVAARGGSADAPAAPQPAAPAPVASPSPSPRAAPAASSPASWQTATKGGASASGPVLAAAPDTAATPDTSSVASGGSGLGSFFGNLFGGAATAGATPGPSTTASTTATSPASGPASATSSWSDATSVATGKSRPPAAAAAPASPPAAAPVRTAAAAPTAAVPAAPALKGKYRLQVAAVRSRAEAETLAAKLKQAHGSAIGGREPVIEQSVIGAMGTFYRVRVGPYADASEPRQLCSRIKPDGFDCLVVTQ